jgi:hypothetical protein
MRTHLRCSVALLALSATVSTLAGSGDAVTQELNSTRGVGTSDAVIHLDQDETTFDSTVAFEHGDGLKLVDVEVLTITGTGTRFSGVFYPVSGTIHTLIHGTGVEWQAFLNTVNPLDGRWLDIEVGFHGNPDRRYSAIFLEDGDDYNYLVDTNMSDSQLQTHMENQLRAGFSLIDFEAHTIPGSGLTAFDAIWVKDPNQPMTHLYYDLELADMQDLWTPLAGRIIDFERYYSSFFNEERFAIVVANHPGGEYLVDTWMTNAEVGTTNVSVSDSDTHLIDLHAFENGGSALYSGVWGENWKSLNEVGELTPFVNNLALTTDLNDLIQDFEVNKPHNEGIIGFYAKNLRTQQAVGYRKDEPFYLGSATKTVAHIRLWMQIEDNHFDPDDEGTMVPFSLHSETGAPHYVEDRGWPGFSSGTPEHSWCTGGTNAGASCSMNSDCNSNVCTPQNNLGNQYSLNRYDVGMMESSDNSATSLLIDDQTVGLSHDTTNLNEWLSSIDGVSQGWGLVTSINDLDRLIHWQGQHTLARRNDPSFFLAPSHTFGPFQRKDYRACTVAASAPIACVPAAGCTRCSVDADCEAPEFCTAIRDPWTDLATHMGIPIGAVPPDPHWETGRRRYYAMGLNSATPRAYANLLEKFWKGDFLADNTEALSNMLESSQLGDDFACRIDADGDATCDPGEGWKTWAAKGGSKGSVADGTKICVDTAIFEMTGGGGSDVIAMTIMMRDNYAECGIGGLFNDLRNWWEGPFGDAMARAVTVDLEPRGTIVPTFALRGGQFDILTLDVDNLGGAVSGSFTVRIFADQNQDATGGYFVDNIVVPSVAGDSTYSAGTVSIDLSNSIPEGEYWLFAVADAFNEVGEYDDTQTSNIERISGGKLYILPPCPDDDLDGYSVCSPQCIADGTICGDCAPADPSVYPGAVEICDGIDNDCDTIIDNNIPTPLVTEHIEHEDPLAYDHFGQALANLGDLNGDAIDDLAIGMPGDNVAGLADVGRVRVLSGADQSTICDALLPTPVGYDYLGEAVAAAGGDLNGNGQPDFVAGVPGYDGAASNTGAIAVFNGPDCAFIRLIEDPTMAATDRWGVSVASIGDADGDLISDIAAGSIDSDLGGSNRGAIKLFSGATGALLFTMFDPAADGLGESLAGPGDLSGDGVPDIAAGAPDTDVVNSNDGAVYIFSGANGAYVDRFSDPTGESSARLGTSIAALGDLGVDGISELGAAQKGDYVNGDRIGSVAIFEGSSGVVIERLINPIAVPGVTEGFPAGIAPIADMNGDGVIDVLVGADHDDDLALNAGSVFVFDSVSGAVLHHVFDSAGNADDQLGSTVISLGDISGDGVADFAAGAPKADNIEARESGHLVLFVLEEDCDNDGHSPYGGDCSDMDPLIFPLAAEVCDMADNDCDGLTDEDSDGDGYDVCNDCDDDNASINPDAPIDVCNGVDDDCDGSIDEAAIPGNPDGDTATGACFDCDETDPLINVSQPDTCNHIDDDCSGIPDDGFPKVVSTRFSMLPSGLDDDELGTDVAAIGDVNADGIPDFVAGAPHADIGGSSSGSAVVFDGATGATVCVATPGSQGYAQAGLSVAGVGDVNNDGTPDFAMGAPYHDVSVVDQGMVYVINGDDCTLIRELIDANGQGSDRLGWSVAGIGDLTGDGVGEIAGGAPRAFTSFNSDAGAVLVWNGATGAELLKLTGTHSGGNRVGTSVAGIGDVNADGVPDILAGAPYEDGLLGGNAGSVMVFSGFDGSIIHKIFDPDGTGSDLLGTSVAGITDLTGDHVPDILAGSPNEDTGGANTGAILVFSGADGTLAQRVPLVDVTTTLRFGTSVAVVGDLTGDLIPEFAGGAPDDDTEGTNTGRILVIDGADFSVVHDFTLPGSSPSSNLGIALDGIGDLNGDGEPEILIGQPRQHTQEDADVGRVVVFSFESDCDNDGVGPFEEDCDDQDGLRYPGFIEICDGIDNDCDVSIDEDEDGDGDDACVDCAPAVPTISTTMEEVCNAVDDNCDMQADEGVDLDGDSYTTPCDCDDDDFDVNASAVEVCNTIDDNCDGKIDEGFASPLDQVRILDPEPNVADDVGYSIALVGDVDSDSFPDIVIGVPGEDTGANGGGSALLISGATRSVICRLVDPAALTSDAMGRGVAGVGDVTGDGTPDIAVGGRTDDGAGQASGSVQIYDGATCAWVRELKDPAAAPSDFFGDAIASIGDVTGDTVPDIAVASRLDDENGYTNVGSVSVFNGATGVFLYKALDPHGRSNDQSGRSVSALGDVDFDGVPDFAAGALADNVSPHNPGTVNLFSGIDGSWIRSLTDLTLGANGYLGRSVAAAGDMNGDGIPDLISGAEGDDTGATNAGAVLAFSGLDGSLIRRYVDSSPLQSADLGASVVAAGDINGDGITEVIAGGPDSSRTGSSAGEVVLFDGATGVVLHRFTDALSQAGDDFGYVVIAADLNGGGIEILAGAPNGDPGGLNSAGYVTVFTLDADCDGDGYSPLADCDDTNGGTQGEPGAAQSLLFSDKTTLQWTAPADPGLSPGTLVYDVVRSNDPSDFMTAPTCVESDDGADTTATDSDSPGPGVLYAYLVRVETLCGAAADPGRAVAQCP